LTAFWDSSAVVPLCCAQSATAESRRLLADLGGIVAWWGTPVEARSAFARLRRGGEVTPVQLSNAIKLLDQLRRSWDEILPTEAVRVTAESLPGDHGIRAGDAWQLAAALVWCRERPRRRAFVCLDKRLAKAASDVGFTVHPN
jgi:predicted nucleic acid-binding protein